mgnify:CR=1 FL=1
MSGNRLFVDTNILIYFLKGDQEVIEMLSDKNPVISFITELEVLSFPGDSSNNEEIIKGLLKNCSIIDINSEIKKRTITFRKKSNLKLPDAIIAATAQFTGLPLLTGDQQFKSVKGLDIILYEL